MVTGQSIAQEAFEQLQKTVHVSDQIRFEDTTLEDVLQVIQEVSKKQAERRDLRFMRRIESFIKTIDSYSEIFGLLCQGWPPMSFVWGPIKWILNMARNYFDIIDAILQAYNDIAENLPKIDLLRAAFPDSEKLNQTVGWIYNDLLEFHKQAYKMFRRRAWHFYFSFDWGLYQKRFKSILQRLSRHTDMLDKVAAATHFAEMRVFRDQRKEEDEEFEKRWQLNMFQDVRKWLTESQDAQEEFLHHLCETRQVDTCNWILKEPEFVRWLEDGPNSRSLWMTGIPGSGKSILTSMIIEHVRTRPGCCAFFFCGPVDFADVSCVKILRTLASQIVSKNADIAPLIHEAFLRKGSCSTTVALKKLLAQILPEIQSTYFILDGLDELEHSVQEEILRSLNDIIKTAQVNSSLLISSREEPQIKKFSFQSQLRLEGKTKGAICLYIRHTVENLRSNHDYIDDLLATEIEKHLRGKANGMFLWVRLVFAMLNEKGTYTDMETAIGDLPDGLEKAYGRVLSRIEKKLTPYLRLRVFKILSWLCVGRRPVSIDEVVDGVALDFEHRELNRKTRISNPDREILDLCAPLLEKTASATLGLVHFSAKEYLLSYQSGPTGPFLKPSLAHFHIAQSCIVNLTTAIDFIRSGSSPDVAELETRTVRGTYGLMGYSAQFWADHLLLYFSDGEEVVPDGKQKMLSLLNPLCTLAKRQTKQWSPSPPAGISENVANGLKELECEPELFQLVVSCLELPQKLVEIQANFHDPEQQEQRLLLSDNTFMTLITCRLRDTTNHLLTLPESALPPHIELIDHQKFLKRFGWRCKHIGCPHEFKSETDKILHEQGHVISFPCSYCDFFMKGFRSRKELERHVRNYHLDPEELEVPTSLCFDENMTNSMANDLRKRQLRCWNKRGVKAAQQGLRQVLNYMNRESSGKLAIEKIESFEVDSLKQKIDEDRYDSLEDFKQDLRQTMLATGGRDNLSMNHAIDVACQNGLRYAIKDFPGFANVEDNAWTSQNLELQNFMDENQGVLKTEPLDNWKAIELSLSEESLRNRSVYWSANEKIEIPDLLRKFGKDFSKIAEELGTKSKDDIDKFVARLFKERPDIEEILSENNRVPENVQRKDLELFPAAQMVEPTQSLSAQNEVPQSVSFPGILTSELMASQLRLDSAASQHHQPFPGTSAPNLTPGQAEGARPELPVRKKRVRPRAYCSECNHYPDGLHDEYALQKHVDRFHRRHRKVWICNDISDGKRYLDGCSPCESSKRYNAKHDACKHLRSAHFTPAITGQILNKWLREEEELNPSFGLKPGEKPPKTMPALKRQKTEEATLRIAPLRFAHQEIAPLNFTPQENILLPPIRAGLEMDGADDVDRMRPNRDANPNETKDSSDDLASLYPSSESLPSMPGTEDSNTFQLRTHEPGALKNTNNSRVSPWLASLKSDFSFDSPKPESTANENSHPDLILPDVSFDNLIGIKGLTSDYYESNGPPHRSKQALIKPDQVPRLPHLERSRRDVYIDQVESLYYRLDEEEPETEKYKVQLVKLEELSRMLMGNLKIWQQERSRAPHIPFSLN